MECSKDKNLKDCLCTYADCSKKGKCCECIRFHQGVGEIPACFFSPKAEKTYNRSIEKFIEDYQNK